MFPCMLEEVLRFLAPAAGGTYHRRHVRRGRLHAAPSSVPGRAVIAIDRDPTAIAARRRTRRGICGQADPGRGPLLRPRRDRPRSRSRPGRRRRPRHRRIVDADRRAGARLLLPPRRSARHAHGRRWAERRRCRQPHGAARSRPRHRRARRREAGPRRRFGDRQGAGKLAPSAAPSNSPKSSPARSGAAPADTIHPATRTFQALRIFVNRELERTRRGARRLRARAGRGRDAGGGRLPFARGSHRQALPRRTVGREGAAARATCRKQVAAVPTFELLSRGAVEASDELRSRESAGALGAATGGASHRRADRDRSISPRSVFRNCPRSHWGGPS